MYNIQHKCNLHAAVKTGVKLNTKNLASKIGCPFKIGMVAYAVAIVVSSLRNIILGLDPQEQSTCLCSSIVSHTLPAIFYKTSKCNQPRRKPPQYPGQ